MFEVSPAGWHVDPVSVDDDRRMREVQELLSEREGWQVTKTSVIRRAVRLFHARTVAEHVVTGGGEQ